MRNAAADQLAERRLLVGGCLCIKAQVGVLIVQPGDGPVRRNSVGLRSPRRRPPLRHGQVQVVRDVALAHGQDGESRFGAGLHDADDFQRRPQGLAQLQALAHARQVLAVLHMVMRDVAA